jgi:hypothetical protein
VVDDLLERPVRTGEHDADRRPTVVVGPGRRDVEVVLGCVPHGDAIDGCGFRHDPRDDQDPEHGDDRQEDPQRLDSPR